MKVTERVEAFCKLGDVMGNLRLNDRNALAEKARNENPWFIEANVLFALNGAALLLEREKLKQWAFSYSPEPVSPRIVGVAMAGNVPLVGFHDFLTVLISGHRLRQKLSSKDSVLIKFILKKLVEIEPRFSERVSTEESMKGVDAMIATGSDNTARYFEYYFRHIPHIIRKNRASCAIIQGDEPKKELHRLGQDVFSYFGLGCRNVSKLYVPEEFDLPGLIECWTSFESIIEHDKYAHNYDYQKSILLVNKEPYLDTGFVLLHENKNLVSPVATLYYERYQGLKDLKEKIEKQSEKLQVVVSAQGWFEGSIPFGRAQLPEVSDYADHVDTMKFLTDLK